MAPSPAKIPHLLEPYIHLPSSGSLLLLTSVLGASTNWLVLRYLSAVLAGDANGATATDGPGINGGAKVVLVSFMRDMNFWREGARRLGLDLPKLISQKRFAFVDGLSGLYLPDTEKIPDKAGEHTLRSPDLSKVSSTIQTACQSLQSSPSSSDKVLLILDSLDLLLATQEGTLTPQDLSDTLLDLRTQTHATVLTLTASSPLILRQSTPLEVNHAALTLSIAHQADLILALRLLDTGTAKDVSGVVRITEREGWDRREGREGNGEGLREGGKELLYYVGQDGGARVFERGQ